MGGFAAAIGGAGNEAAQYGQQIRGLLEQRRTHFADLFMQLAGQEVDPQRRAAYLGHASDLMAGKDLSKIIPAAAKTVQQHMDGNQILAQAAGGLPGKPQQTPTNLPGATPGTAMKPAAQPTTSPVSPMAQQIGTPVNASPVPPQASMMGPEQAAQNAPPLQPLAQAPAVPPATGGQPGGDFGLPTDIGGMAPTVLMQTPQGREVLRPFFNNVAEFARMKGIQQIEMGWKQKALDELVKSPEWADLHPMLKAQWHMWASTPGAQMPSSYGLAGMYSVHQEKVDVTDWPAEKKIAAGVPPDAMGPQLVNIDRLGNMGQSLGAAYVPPMVSQTPGGEQLSSRVTGKQVAPIAGAIPPAMNTPHTAPTAAGGVEQYTPGQVAAGQAPIPIPGAVAPAMLPTTTSEPRFIQTTDAQGNPVTQEVPVTVTHQKTASGAVPPAGAPSTTAGLPSIPRTGGGRTFEKPLTPEQHVKSQQQYEQYNMAIDRAQRVIKNIHLLDSMIDAGKMQLQLHDGLLASFVNRNVPLTQAEAQMVTDFNSLTESVNLVRGPLGATGFRGPEAFSALQAQRGKLLGRPEITEGVLKNFVKELTNQSVPLAKVLHSQDTVRFTDGGRPYTIPAPMVTEFIKDHPNAQRQ